MNFGTVIRRYNSHHRQHTLDEIAWFTSQPTLRKAVELAALAQNQHGKRYSHQYRIKQSALSEAKSLLLAAVKDFEQCNNFDEVHRLVKHELDEVYGIGELYIYDTAFRIGAKLNLLPEKVYLHAGVKRGASVLKLDTKGETIEVKDLPGGLRHLAAYELEDILCIFKRKFK